MTGSKHLFLAFLTAGALINSTAASANAAAPSDNPFDKNACTFKGFALNGNIQVVENFPDIKVQIVENFADIHVQLVTSFPDKCGQWKFVESFPDVKIQYVDNFPDIKIKMVTSFPGPQ